MAGNKEVVEEWKADNKEVAEVKGNNGVNVRRVKAAEEEHQAAAAAVVKVVVRRAAVAVRDRNFCENCSYRIPAYAGMTVSEQVYFLSASGMYSGNFLSA